MSLVRAVTTGTAVGGVLAIVIAGSAWPCTPEEYMSAEERASGQYDTTPPGYAADWGGAPHTHDAADPAAQGTPAPASSAPQPASGGTKQRTTGRQTREAASAPQSRAQQQPTKPRSQVATAPPPATAAPAATSAVAVTPAPAAAPRPSVRPRARTTRKARPARRSTARREPAPSAQPVAREPQTPDMRPVVAAPEAQSSRDHAPLIALAILSLGLALAAGRQRRRPAGPIAPVPPEPRSPVDGTDVEAELQEMLAEERARAASGRLTAHR